MKTLIALGLLCASVVASANAVAEGYTQLEWMRGNYVANADATKAIGGGGNCPNGSWVDTGYVPTPTDTIEIKFRLNELGFNQALFSARPFDGHEGTISAFFLNTNCIRFDRKSLDVNKITVKNKISTGKDYIVRLDGKNLKGELIDGDTKYSVTLTSGDFKATNTLFVCANKGSNGAVAGVSPWRFYYIKVTDENGVVKFNGVPARDESKTQGNLVRYGIFDTVGNAFHPNSGNQPYYMVGAKDKSLMPNGSFETGVKGMKVTELDSGYVNTDESGISDWKGGIITCPGNVQVKTSTVPDGDYALAIRNDAAATNAFVVSERGIYELSLRFLARWVPDKWATVVATGHQVDIFIDGRRLVRFSSTAVDSWSSLTRLIALDAGEHQLVLRGLLPESKVRATIIDDVRLVKTESKVPAAADISAYAESGAMSLCYDARSSGDGMCNLMNLGTAGSAFDLFTGRPQNSYVTNGVAMTGRAWFMYEPVPAAEALSVSEGYTLEVCYRRRGGQSVNDRGFVISSSPDEGTTGTGGLPFFIADSAEDKNKVYVGARNTGYASPENLITTHVASDRFATRAITVDPETGITYYENGVQCGTGVFGDGEFQPIARLTLGDIRRNRGLYWEGEISAVRFYTKILTPEQLAQNAAVDRRRRLSQGLIIVFR